MDEMKSIEELRITICEEFYKIDPKLSTEEFADKFSHNLEVALVKLLKETGPIKL